MCLFVCKGVHCAINADVCVCRCYQEICGCMGNFSSIILFLFYSFFNRFILILSFALFWRLSIKGHTQIHRTRNVLMFEKKV